MHFHENRPKHLGKILLLDDDSLFLWIAETILHDIGYRVTAVRSGEKAVSLYKGEMESGQPFDAVILDLNINRGMGGEEVMRRLREIDPGVRAVVSSGDFDNPVMKDFGSYGFKGLLPKPYSPSEVNEALSKAMAV